MQVTRMCNRAASLTGTPVTFTVRMSHKSVVTVNEDVSQFEQVALLLADGQEREREKGTVLVLQSVAGYSHVTLSRTGVLP